MHTCPDCLGEGSFGTLGAFTQNEFEEAFESFEEYQEMHETTKRQCQWCNGTGNVNSDKMEQWKDELEYRNEIAAEQRHFGYC